MNKNRIGSRGFRERKDFAPISRATKNPDGWVEILKKNNKPGQVNAHVNLIALRQHMDILNSDIKREMITQQNRGIKFDVSSGDIIDLNRNNTSAFAEVFAISYLPTHICNLAIVKTEENFGNWKDTDIKNGLGTTGEVTDIKALGKIVSKYGPEVVETMKRKSMLMTTPVLINDEEMLIIYEDIKVSCPKNNLKLQFAIIRPEVMERLSSRTKGNATFKINSVADMIYDYETLETKVKDAYNNCDISEVDFVATFANNTATINADDTKYLEEIGMEAASLESKTVSKEDCFYISNPALLSGLMDYRQIVEEDAVRKDFIPLSSFQDKIGNDKVVYLSEFVDIEGNKEDPEGDKPEDSGENKDKDDLLIKLSSMIEKEVLTISDIKTRNNELVYLDDRAHTTRSLEKIRSKAETVHLEDDDDISDADIHGIKEIKNMQVSYEYFVSSMDPKYWKTSGYKNAGYYSTVDISVADLMIQLNQFISMVFASNKTSSSLVDYLKKLIDIKDMRSGHIQDKLASDSLGMKNHFIDAARSDFLLIANNQNFFFPTVGDKIAKNRIRVCGEDVHCTETSMVEFNKTPKLKVGSYFSIAELEDHCESTRLPNGIGVVMMDSSGNLVDALEMQSVKLPIPTVYKVKTATQNKASMVLDYSTGRADAVVESYFNGYSFAKGKTDMNIEYDDLVEGVDIKKDLKGTETFKTLSKITHDVRKNDIIDYTVTTIEFGVKVGLDSLRMSDREDVIISIIPASYKRTRPVSGLDMLYNVWRELIYSKKISIQTKEFDRSRTIVKEPNDIYGIMADIASNENFSLDYSVYGGYITFEEQRVLTDYKLMGKTIRVSENFITLFAEIGKAIETKINMEFNNKFDVIDEVRDINSSVENFQIAIRKNIIDAISGYTLIERLYILKYLFRDVKKSKLNK